MALIKCNYTDKKGGSGGPKPESPFNEYFGKFMQAAKITTKPMSKGEAIKILNIKNPEQLEPKEIMDVKSKILGKVVLNCIIELYEAI